MKKERRHVRPPEIRRRPIRLTAELTCCRPLSCGWRSNPLDDAGCAASELVTDESKRFLGETPEVMQ